jgi:hypothetical protein
MDELFCDDVKQRRFWQTRETPAGSRVFAAGVLNFGGEMLLWPESTRLVENVWSRLAQP